MSRTPAVAGRCLLAGLCPSVGFRDSLPQLLGAALLAAMSITGAAGASDSPPAFPEPEEVTIEDDKAVQIDVQFGISNVLFTGKTRTTPIWTRAYEYAGKLCTMDGQAYQGEGCADDLIPPPERTPSDVLAIHTKEFEVTIPGPSLAFQPGQFLQVTLNNLLSEDEYNSLIHIYDTNVDPTFDTDEVAHHVRHEVNLPHDPNNTNLHVHGLHVDPTIDDVTLVIIPKGESKMDYSPSLWPHIREQVWPYQYRIPSDHLPGTHWYHAHKHGSTSLHVENGMAGALVISPTDPADDIVPGLPAADDHVMILQEIANYGVQQGVAGGSAALTDFDVDSAAVSAPGIGGTTPAQGRKNRPIVTVNGEHEPTLYLKAKQLSRWRFINATSNHHSFSHLWVGKVVGKTQKGGVKYQETPAYIVALDGITLNRKVEITAQHPLFLGPGNRADVLFVEDQAGTYSFIKGVPSDAVVVDAQGNDITNRLMIARDWISANPYLLPEVNPFPGNDNNVTLTTGGPSANYVNFRRNWLYRNADPTSSEIGQPSSIQGVALTPNVWVMPQENSDGSTFLGVDFARDPDHDNFGWQPIDFNDITAGTVTPQVLFDIEVSAIAAKDPLPLPSREHLASISPTGGMANRPLYVDPVTNGDILQSRTALFDLSGIDVLTRDRITGLAEQQIRQFTLNGRQFDLADSIGSDDAESLLSEYPTLHAGGSVNLQLVRTEAHGLFNNDCWTNPGYYKALERTDEPIGDGPPPSFYYRYAGTERPCSGEPKLEYKDVTGLDTVSVVNTGYRGGTDWNGIPGLPVSTTAEEWVLVNNSPTGHPFHIHINPFFVTEVGQASYEPFEGSSYCRNEASCRKDPTQTMCRPPTDTSESNGGWGWAMRTIDPNPDPKQRPENSCGMAVPDGPKFLRGTNTMSWVVDNWLDTIVIPPHGYVKFRYWMNVPQQNDSGSVIEENVNRFGNWVYHCHILRHEDRGMMMIVGTQPKRPAAMTETESKD